LQELALSISIILSNLSDDPGYVEKLLGSEKIAKAWANRDQSALKKSQKIITSKESDKLPMEFILQ